MPSRPSSRPRGLPARPAAASDEDRPADQGGRRGGQGRRGDTRREDRRGRRQGPPPESKPIKTYNYRAPGERPGLRRLDVGSPRPDHARASPGRAASLLQLVSDQGHAPAPRPRGSRVFFVTTVDDYGEVWVDGKLHHKVGQPAADRRRVQRPEPGRAEGRQAGQVLPDRRLRHQRADLGHAGELDLPRGHVPGNRGQEMTAAARRSGLVGRAESVDWDSVIIDATRCCVAPHRYLLGCSDAH